MNTQNKGLHPLAWVAIGCGALALIAVVVVVAGGLFVAKKVGDATADLDFENKPAQAAAEMFVRLNPEIELVESDSESGKMTIREISSGETVTLNFDEIAKGNFSFENSKGETVRIDASGAEKGEAVKVTTNEGEVTFGAGDSVKLPDWLILYPGASEPQSAYHASTPEGVGGLCTLESSDPVDDVIKFYEEELKSAGYEVSTVRMDSAQGKQGIVTGNSTSPKRTQTVNVLREDGKSQIGITYSGS